jgi:hypothetical protein
MPGLRDSILTSVKPLARPISIRSVAKIVGLGDPPISGRRLLDFTSPPILINSGEMHAQTVRGSASLLLHASGAYIFQGHAHENGVVGDHYAVSCAIDVRDGQGRALALQPHEKTLSGTDNPLGDRNDDFQIVAFDQRIRDRWHEVVAARKQFSFHAATDGAQVVASVTEGLIAAFAVAGLVFLAVVVIPLIAIPKFGIKPTEDGHGGIVTFQWGLDQPDLPPVPPAAPNQ